MLKPYPGGRETAGSNWELIFQPHQTRHLGAKDLHGIGDALRCEPNRGKDERLESLSTTAHVLADIKPGWKLGLKAHAMAEQCLSGQQIFNLAYS